MRGNQKSGLQRMTNSTRTPMRKPTSPLRSAAARKNAWRRFAARLASGQAARQLRHDVASNKAFRELCEKMDQQRAISLDVLFRFPRTRRFTIAQVDALVWLLERVNVHVWKVDGVTWIRSEQTPVDEQAFR